MTTRDEDQVPAGTDPGADPHPGASLASSASLTEDGGDGGDVTDADAGGPSRGGCRTRLRGWAGAHSHGAVRPRRRAAGRGRPPGRWC